MKKKLSVQTIMKQLEAGVFKKDELEHRERSRLMAFSLILA